jgi:uncharacterized protein YqeY
MSLRQRIDEDLKRAMKAHDESALTAVRMLKAAITNREIELKKEADEAELIRLVEKQLKQRKESAEAFRNGGRPELAEKEEKEAAVLSAYLPQRLSEQELEALVAQAVAESGATSVKQMGQVMKLAQQKAAGRADGKAISEAVKKKLSGP